MYRTYEERLNALTKVRRRKELRRIRQERNEVESRVAGQARYIKELERDRDFLKSQIQEIERRIADMNDVSVLLEPQSKHVDHHSRLSRINQPHFPRVGTWGMADNVSLIIHNLDMIDAAVKQGEDHYMLKAMHFFVRTPEGDLAYKLTEEAWQLVKRDEKRLAYYIGELFANELARPETWEK